MRRQQLYICACLLLGIALAACSGKKNGGQGLPEGIASVIQADGQSSDGDWSLDGNTLTYGSHVYTMTGNMEKNYVPGAKGKVTFTNVPSDLDEFSTVYEQLLGKTPYGIAAMLPMAFEMWGRNHDEGEQCIEMITGFTCFREIMRQLPAHMEMSKHSPVDDPYVQRCLPAAVLEGATKENGYNPTEPYTVNMTIGREETWGEESEMLQGEVYQLNILSGNAWSTQQRSVSVMLPWKGPQLYKVNSCPSLYVNIFVPRKDWEGLK